MTMRSSALILAVILPASSSQAAPEIRLSADARALLPVVVSTRASTRVRAAATTLADYLGRISGGKFTVEAGDGQAGIAVGRSGDFGLPSPWDTKDAARREDYLLRSHAKGLHAIGASEMGVENAVWDLLHRL